MFEFEQDLGERLTLDDSGHPTAEQPSSSVAFAPIRPQNPMAAVLDDHEFASLSASPFGEYGSPSVLRMAADAAPAPICERSPSFDFNGRRKRKYVDDSCCVTPRVRPMAKRAKSFSCVSEVLLPSLVSAANADAGKLDASSISSILDADSSAVGKRSASIQIPRHGMRVHGQDRSASGPSRGMHHHHHHRPLEPPAASSDPLVSHANSSSSWNARVEYFCRRSLDISSPLRLRLRDLVVGSAGRVGSLQSP